jgi:hypothetical protein
MLSRVRFLTIGLALPALLLVPTTSQAQAADAAAPRVRLDLRTAAADRAARGAPIQSLTGTLAAVYRDSVLLQLDTNAIPLRVSTADVRATWLSLGREGWLRAGLRGSAKPALFGLAFGVLRATLLPMREDGSVAQVALSNALFSGLFGAIRAGWENADRWRPTTLDALTPTSAPTVAATPSAPTTTSAPRRAVPPCDY